MFVAQLTHESEMLVRDKGAVVNYDFLGMPLSGIRSQVVNYDFLRLIVPFSESCPESGLFSISLSALRTSS